MGRSRRQRTTQFERIAIPFLPEVYRLARQVSDESRAPDLVQETYMRHGSILILLNMALIVAPGCFESFITSGEINGVPRSGNCPYQTMKRHLSSLITIGKTVLSATSLLGRLPEHCPKCPPFIVGLFCSRTLKNCHIGRLPKS